MVTAVRRTSARAAAKRALELTDLLSSDSEDDLHSEPYHAAEQDSDQESDGEAEGESDREHVEESHRRPAKRARKAPAAENSPDVAENMLYKALSSMDVDVSDLALEWLETYAEDELNDDSNAITELFNLVLRCCGCVHLVQKHDMINADSAAATVAELCLLFEKQRYHEYPYVSTNKSIKFFRRNVVEFFESLIVVSHEKGMLYTSSDESTSSSLSSPMMNDVLAWLTALSGSNIRPFRYVSTSILMVIQTTLSEQSVSLTLSLEKQQRQLNIAKNNKTRNQRAHQRKIDIISESIDRFSRQCDTIAEYLVDLFQNVFVRRYRDIDSGIRAECVKALGQWMTIHEEYFLQAKYLRYFGWLLSDPCDNVREEVVKSLHKLYKHITSRSESMSIGFRQFTERFKKQFINMMWKESHIGIKIHLYGIYNEIYKLGFLGDAEIHEIGLFGFYLAESTSKQDKVKSEWARLLMTICVDKLQKEMEKYTVFLSSHTSSMFGSEDDQLDLNQCINFNNLADLLQASYSQYITSKRLSVSVLKITLDFHELVVLLFSTIYSLLEVQGTWKFLVRYILCDISSAKFEDGSTNEDDCVLTQEDDLKERLEINSIGKRVTFLGFIAGAFNHIIFKKTSRRLDDAESQDNINVALPMLAQYLPQLEKYLSKSSKLYVVFMGFWNMILLPLSRSLSSIYNNASSVAEYNSIHGNILQFYADVEDFDDGLQNVFDQYFSLLLKHFDYGRPAEHGGADSEIVLNASITIKVEDLLTSLSAEAVASFNSKDLIEDFNPEDDEAILPEDQKVLCNRMLKSTTALQKLSHLAKMINVNKYIAEPILDYERSLLQYIATKFLSKIDYRSLTKLWPNNYLHILLQVQLSWEAILDLILMSLCWKLEDLMHSSNDKSALLVNIDLFLDDFKGIMNSLTVILEAVQLSYRELNENTSESNKSMRKLVESLVKLSSTFADHIIDGIVSLRVFYHKLKSRNSFKDFELFFSNIDGIGKFVQGTIPKQLQSALMNLFLIDEAQLAKLSSTELERGENEDVNYGDFCFESAIVIEEPVRIEATEFGGSDDEDDDILGKVDPRVEAEAREAEVAAKSATRQKQALWAVEKRFFVYVVKMLSLINTGGFSEENVNRLSLNESVLGEFYRKILEEGNKMAQFEVVDEVGDLTINHTLLTQADI